LIAGLLWAKLDVDVYGEELQMKRRILLGMTFTLVLAAFPTSVFGQAAAESVLLNGASAGATAKFGSQLGSALNQSSKQLAGRVQQQIRPAPGKGSPAGARPISKSPVQGAAVRAGATPAQGPIIASIQGAATRCAPTNQTASTAEGKTVAESARTSCAGQNSASKSAPQKYKPVITLSLQK
jgi:cytochrome c biogenesis protein CcdA